MKTFEFTVVLAGLNGLTDDDAEKLFIAGCDDATPGACNQAATIHFCRDSESFQQAILSAKSDIEKAGFGVERVEIGARDLGALEAV